MVRFSGKARYSGLVCNLYEIFIKHLMKCKTEYVQFLKVLCFLGHDTQSNIFSYKNMPSTVWIGVLCIQNYQIFRKFGNFTSIYRVGIVSSHHRFTNERRRSICSLGYEQRHEVSNNEVCATSKGSDKPAHTHSLIRVFASRLHILSL